MYAARCDHWEIAAVKARYFRFMDLKDWPALRSIFADDAVYHHPTVGQFDDVDAAVESLRTTIGERWTSHEGSIPDITLLSPDRAIAVFAMTGHAMLDDGQLGRTFGHYYDEFTRIDGAWKISSLRLVSTLRTV